MLTLFTIGQIWILLKLKENYFLRIETNEIIYKNPWQVWTSIFIFGMNNFTIDGKKSIILTTTHGREPWYRIMSVLYSLLKTS